MSAAEAPAMLRVKCRQIVESDLDTLVDLYLEGFPYTRREFWADGMKRLVTMPTVEGVPRFGYALETQDGLVGALLTLSSRRGDTIISNVSGWYVRKPYRAHSMLLVSTATRQKHVIYLNASPAPHTRKTLEAADWKQYSFGQSLVLPLLNLRGGHVSETIPHDLPERALLEDHRRWGHSSVVCTTAQGTFPFVFRRHWIGPKQRKVPFMELIYCRDTNDFDHCSGALWRYFLKRRLGLGLLLDGKSRTLFSLYRPGRDDRMYKGPRQPSLNDLAYTEKVIFL